MKVKCYQLNVCIYPIDENVAENTAKNKNKNFIVAHQ